MGLRFFRQPQEILGVAAADGLSFFELHEPLGRELADRLQHPEALRRGPQQAQVEERLERVEIGARHLLGRRQREPTENTESRPRNASSSAVSRS